MLPSVEYSRTTSRGVPYRRRFHDRDSVRVNVSPDEARQKNVVLLLLVIGIPIAEIISVSDALDDRIIYDDGTVTDDGTGVDDYRASN